MVSSSTKYADNEFDITLVFGPLYHLYDKKDIDACINESIRITKPNGIIFYAFLSVYAIMDSNYMCGDWEDGLKMNFDKNLKVLHFNDQLFTGYDVIEFENLFKNRHVHHLATVGVDGSLETLEKITDFNFSDDAFESYINWHIGVAEKRELLGSNNHLIYVCKKEK